MVNRILNLTSVLNTSGFWPRVRARELRAPVFLSSLPRKTGRCAPPSPHIAAALLLIRPPKIYKLYRTWPPPPPHVKGFFLSIGPHADWRGYEMWGPLPPPRPSQLRWSFQQYFGAKLCTGATIRPNFFGFSFFSFWIFSFCYSLLFLLSFLFYSYSSLLILLFLSLLTLLVGTILRLLILLFLPIF
jgi:hypothetical protein